MVCIARAHFFSLSRPLARETVRRCDVNVGPSAGVEYRWPLPDPGPICRYRLPCAVPTRLPCRSGASLLQQFCYQNAPPTSRITAFSLIFSPSAVFPPSIFLPLHLLARATPYLSIFLSSTARRGIACVLIRLVCIPQHDFAMYFSTILAPLIFAATSLAQAVPEGVTPPSSPPEGCETTVSGSFQIGTLENPTLRHKRATAQVVSTPPAAMKPCLKLTCTFLGS